MDELIQIFQSHSIALSPHQAQQFHRYFCLLVEWNERMNLTTITAERDVYIKHFLDSALPYFSLITGSSAVDIGSGAGFPSIPLAILRPDVDFTLVDSLNKRITFLDVVKTELSLDNITSHHSRAEDFAAKHRQKFDFAIARAVASLPTLLEYLSPLVKVNGKVMAYKGKDCEGEITLAASAMKALNLSSPEVLNFSLPGGMGERAILVFTKLNNTSPIYPRGGNRPRSQPL